MFDKVLNTSLYPTWSVRTRSFSGPYFPAFGLNTDQKTPNMGTFQAVCILPYSFQIRKNTEEKALYPNKIYALKMIVTDPFGGQVNLNPLVLKPR